MPHIVLFEDNEDQAHQRQTHMADHLAFLEDQCTSEIAAAGPLYLIRRIQVPGDCGLSTHPRAPPFEALVEADPFWPTGLRKIRSHPDSGARYLPMAPF